jgi:hypothetical protein
MCGQLLRAECVELRGKSNNNRNRRHCKLLPAKYPQQVVLHVEALLELNWGYGIV